MSASNISNLVSLYNSYLFLFVCIKLDLKLSTEVKTRLKTDCLTPLYRRLEDAFVLVLS